MKNTMIQKIRNAKEKDLNKKIKQHINICCFTYNNLSYRLATSASVATTTTKDY